MSDDNVASPQSLRPPTPAEFLRAQASNTYCLMGHAQVGRDNSEFNVNTEGLLVRRSRVDVALQIVPPLLHCSSF